MKKVLMVLVALVIVFECVSAVIAYKALSNGDIVIYEVTDKSEVKSEVKEVKDPELTDDELIDLVVDLTNGGYLGEGYFAEKVMVGGNTCVYIIEAVDDEVFDYIMDANEVRELVYGEDGLTSKDSIEYLEDFAYSSRPNVYFGETIYY